MTHRRTPSRSALVLPGWFFIVSAVVSLAAVVWLAIIAIGDLRGDGTETAAAPSSTPSATTSSPSVTTPSPKPSPTRTTKRPSPKPSPTVDRSAVTVDVLNGTRVPGLARRGSASVQQRGWTVGAVGNWRSGVAATTVFYPRGREAEARQLAKDLGVSAVSPVVSGMSADRLTVVLLSVR